VLDGRARTVVSPEQHAAAATQKNDINQPLWWETWIPGPSPIFRRGEEGSGGRAGGGVKQWQEPSR
jgi:hypothetical protein